MWSYRYAYSGRWTLFWQAKAKRSYSLKNFKFLAKRLIICIDLQFFADCRWHDVKLLFRFKNVQFEIRSGEEVGVFDVSAKFMGVAMERVELIFQVRLASLYASTIIS